nr:hypothetical protein [Enterococcus crotali]
MNVHKKMMYVMGCSFLIGSFSYGLSSESFAEGETEITQTDAAIYESDFTKQLGEWQDVVGKADKTIGSSGLTIGNTKQGANLESVSLNKSAGVKSAGDLEYTFLYEGQTNFGLVFRGDLQDSKNGSLSLIP